MPSNLTLLLFGLFIGTFSALYPRLPAYLPPSLSARLPFLPHQSLSPESQAWAGYQRYQHKIPIAANHDPWDVEEPRLEREHRLMSKDGDKERAKMEERERRALEDRTETAGEENLIGEALPVYFVDADKGQWHTPFGGMPSTGRVGDRSGLEARRGGRERRRRADTVRARFNLGQADPGAHQRDQAQNSHLAFSSFVRLDLPYLRRVCLYPSRLSVVLHSTRSPSPPPPSPVPSSSPSPIKAFSPTPTQCPPMLQDPRG